MIADRKFTRQMIRTVLTVTVTIYLVILDGVVLVPKLAAGSDAPVPSAG